MGGEGKGRSSEAGLAREFAETQRKLNLSQNSRSWSADEDRALTELVKQYGAKNWSMMGSLINRTGKQCRERWMNHLDPHVKKGEWTEGEDYHIFKMVMDHGNRWADIARTMPGRTDNSVKNRFNSAIQHKWEKYKVRYKAEKMGTDTSMDVADASNQHEKLQKLDRQIFDRLAANKSMHPSLGIKRDKKTRQSTRNGSASSRSGGGDGGSGRCRAAMHDGSNKSGGNSPVHQPTSGAGGGLLSLLQAMSNGALSGDPQMAVLAQQMRAQGIALPPPGSEQSYAAYLAQGMGGQPPTIDSPAAIASGGDPSMEPNAAELERLNSLTLEQLVALAQHRYLWDNEKFDPRYRHHIQNMIQHLLTALAQASPQPPFDTADDGSQGGVAGGAGGPFHPPAAPLQVKPESEEGTQGAGGDHEGLPDSHHGSEFVQQYYQHYGRREGDATGKEGQGEGDLAPYDAYAAVPAQTADGAYGGYGGYGAEAAGGFPNTSDPPLHPFLTPTGAASLSANPFEPLAAGQSGSAFGLDLSSYPHPYLYAAAASGEQSTKEKGGGSGEEDTKRRRLTRSYQSSSQSAYPDASARSAFGFPPSDVAHPPSLPEGDTSGRKKRKRRDDTPSPSKGDKSGNHMAEDGLERGTQPASPAGFLPEGTSSLELLHSGHDNALMASLVGGKAGGGRGSGSGSSPAGGGHQRLHGMMPMLDTLIPFHEAADVLTAGGHDLHPSSRSHPLLTLPFKTLTHPLPPDHSEGAASATTHTGSPSSTELLSTNKGAGGMVESSPGVLYTMRSLNGGSSSGRRPAPLSLQEVNGKHPMHMDGVTSSSTLPIAMELSDTPATIVPSEMAKGGGSPGKGGVTDHSWTVDKRD
ncbi:unnamed protein product [Vitrella brassicaformis CCMP3155]|uniref:Uncharacterized protein n=3 Tax=Vitrella brassicaformis TaxID=1169539 RepID=A0A0G4G1H5_VITBC|nr:unnamed protein product [Vitrella brassicaformis CCMP3155]|eukprot:CEM21424.1 unnamed protein product [Vitrella brassicaformis CCMP3155]